MAGINKRNSAEEIQKMQEEAIKRVKEMHSRSKPSNFSQAMHPSVPRSNEKNFQNTEKNDNTLKKRNVSEKHQYSQKRSSNFNMRKTKFIRDSPNKETQNTAPPPKNTKQKSLIGGLPNLIDLIFKDEDKSLLIVLLVLLMDNEENFTILLVIFYLLI